jgi:hypothetical protein
MLPSLPQVKCKTCDVGILQKIRKYRMSGVVVAIGYILLIPSVLGVMFSIFAFFTTMSAASGTKDAAATGAVIAGGIFIFFGIASLVGGLLGWLLVMKKDVLQCSHCGAVVAAS